MKKETIIGIIIAVLLIAGIGYKFYESKNPDSQLFKTVEKADVPQSTSVSVSDVKPLNIERQRPVDGKTYGVIEVGASSFNSFVIKADKNDNWELVSKEFGESLAYEGFATTDDVKLGLKKYLSTMFEKGVAGRNAHFVISSGALKNPKTELIAKAIEQMGYVVNRVTPDQEGKFALKSLIPTVDQSNSLSIDIGSGNTKITWFENGRAKSIETYGAKYYQDGVAEDKVYNDVAKLLKDIPNSNKQNIYMIGGVPFKLAKESKTDDNRFTRLNAPDTYSFGDDAKLKSGIVIYKAIYDNSKDANFIFDWDANFTIGFLLSIN